MWHTKLLTELTEDKLFQLMLRRFPDLTDLNGEDKTAPIDWYYPEEDVYIEAKCRKEHYEGVLYIEKIKWDALIEKKNSWYINSTPNGIYVWIIQKLEEPYWRMKLLPETTQFGKVEYVWKNVGDVFANKCHIQLDHLLLN